MGALAGPYFAVAGLLLIAGLSKLYRPATTAEALAAVRLPRPPRSGRAGRPLRSARAGRPPRSGRAGRPLRSGHGGRPRAVARLVGAAEVVAGAGALVVGSPLFAWLVAACYLAFSVFVVVLLTRAVPVPGCGCFGGSDDAPTPVHVVVDVAAAALAVAVALGSPESLASVAGDQPYLGLPFLALTATTAWLAHAAVTLLPRSLTVTAP